MKSRARGSGGDTTTARNGRHGLALARHAARSPSLVQQPDLNASELDRGRLPQATSSEALAVPGTSAGEFEPSFKTMLGNVTRLCQGHFSVLHLREGDSFRMTAVHRAPPAYVEWRKQLASMRVSEFPYLPLARLARTKAVQHVPDLTKEPAYIERVPPMVALVEAVGVRSLLCIPMLKDTDLIGAIAIYYRETRAFDGAQITLAKSCANRAAIAIESARRLKALWDELFSGARSIKLSADQILFSAGEEGDACYRVDEGLLKASVTDADGDERILAVLGPGSLVGELSMLDGAPRSASIIALRDSSLSLVSRPAFDNFGQSKPELYRYLATLLANRLRDTNDTLAATSFLSIKGRFARALLRLAEAFGREVGEGRIVIRQKVSQADLAALAGVARENVNRLLHDWAGRSLVSRHAGYYCLENLAELQREAED